MAACEQHKRTGSPSAKGIFTMEPIKPPVIDLELLVEAQEAICDVSIMYRTKCEKLHDYCLKNGDDPSMLPIFAAPFKSFKQAGEWGPRSMSAEQRAYAAVHERALHNCNMIEARHAYFVALHQRARQIVERKVKIERKRGPVRRFWEKLVRKVIRIFKKKDPEEERSTAIVPPVAYPLTPHSDAEASSKVLAEISVILPPEVRAEWLDAETKLFSEYVEPKTTLWEMLMKLWKTFADAIIRVPRKLYYIISGAFVRRRRTGKSPSRAA